MVRERSQQQKGRRMSRPHTRGQLRRRYLEQVSVGSILVAAAGLFLSFGLVPASMGYILAAATFGTVAFAFVAAAALPSLRPASRVDCPRCGRKHDLLRNHAWLQCDCRAFVIRGVDGPISVMPLAKVPYPVAEPAS